MKKQNFAICDVEEAYALSLMEYMTERQNVPFEVLAFNEMESLREFTKEHFISLLLISPRMMCGEIERMNIGKIVILSEGEVVRELENYPMVYKYQSSEHLVAEVMNYYACQAAPEDGLLLKRDVRILGVYSPLGRCGKTSFALTLGQILAKSQPVLYMNLEDYAGFQRLMEKEFSSDIADVMYFVRQNKGNTLFKLNAAIQRLGNMDYLPPAFSSGDLRDIKMGEWSRLLDNITVAGGYGTVILDIGEAVEERFALLGACARVYMPVLEDVMARAKISQYEKLLREMNCEEILEKTTQLQLPCCQPVAEGEYFLEQLVQGEMGEYVKGMLADEGHG